VIAEFKEKTVPQMFGVLQKNVKNGHFIGSEVCVKSIKTRGSESRGQDKACTPSNKNVATTISHLHGRTVSQFLMELYQNPHGKISALLKDLTSILQV